MAVVEKKSRVVAGCPVTIESDLYPKIKMTPEEREEFIRQLVEEGPLWDGDKCPLVAPKEIPWINNDLLLKGLEFSRRHTFAIFMANTLALFSGFAVKPETLVILRSQRFRDPLGSFKRVLSTAQRIGSWFASGVFDENSEGFKSLTIVRRMHAIYKKKIDAKIPSPEELGWTPEVTHLTELVKKQLSGFELTSAPMHLLTWTPPNPFSQFDLAITQFLGFTSFLYLFPQALGLPEGKETEEGLQGYLHMYAVIGRLLGLEDRFNLALHTDKILGNRIFELMGISSIATSDERVICLQKSQMDGMSAHFPLLFRLKGWNYFNLEMQVGHIDFFKNGDTLWRDMNLRDKLSYFLLKGSLVLVRKSKVCRTLANYAVIILIQIAAQYYLPRQRR